MCTLLPKSTSWFSMPFGPCWSSSTWPLSLDSSLATLTFTSSSPSMLWQWSFGSPDLSRWLSCIMISLAWPTLNTLLDAVRWETIVELQKLLSYLVLLNGTCAFSSSWTWISNKGYAFGIHTFQFRLRLKVFALIVRSWPLYVWQAAFFGHDYSFGNGLEPQPGQAWYPTYNRSGCLKNGTSCRRSLTLVDLLGLVNSCSPGHSAAFGIISGWFSILVCGYPAFALIITRFKFQLTNVVSDLLRFPPVFRITSCRKVDNFSQCGLSRRSAYLLSQKISLQTASVILIFSLYYVLHISPCSICRSR